jgi:hypothetical protein
MPFKRRQILTGLVLLLAGSLVSAQEQDVFDNLDENPVPEPEASPVKSVELPTFTVAACPGPLLTVAFHDQGIVC